jgi:hypothetical protein
MVMILSVALTSFTRIEQERCTSPLMCTEHAPHWAMPQPYLVPVRPKPNPDRRTSNVAKLNVNGKAIDVKVDGDTPLLWALREQIGDWMRWGVLLD